MEVIQALTSADIVTFVNAHIQWITMAIAGIVALYYGASKLHDQVEDGRAELLKQFQLTAEMWESRASVLEKELDDIRELANRVIKERDQALVDKQDLMNRLDRAHAEIVSLKDEIRKLREGWDNQGQKPPGGAKGSRVSTSLQSTLAHDAEI